MGTGDAASGPSGGDDRISVPGLVEYRRPGVAGSPDGAGATSRRARNEQDARDLCAGLVAIVTGAVIMLLAGGSLQEVAAILTVLTAVGAGILAIAR